MAEQKRFIFIDSNSLVYRAYHAYPSELRTSSGEQVNAIYGFSFLLLKIIEDLSPDYIVAVFDVAKPTIRHKKYEEYKKHRKPMEQEMAEQIPKIKEVIEAFNIPILEVAGYEADDVIGTIEDRKEIRDFEKVIVTVDQDMFQLVDHDTKIYLSGRNFKDSGLYGKQDVIERFGFGPDAVTHYKALFGDPSDNIPGVAGIGKVGATKLIQEYKTLDGVYEHLEEIDARYRNKLEKGKSDAYMSLDLATIMRDAPIEFNLQQCKWGDYNPEQVLTMFQKYQFQSLIKKLESIEGGDRFAKIIEKRRQKKEAKIRNVKSVEELDTFLGDLSKQGRFVLDIMSAEDAILGIPAAFGFCLQDDEVCVVKQELLFANGQLTNFGEKVRDTLNDEKIVVIGHDVKRVLHGLYNVGIQPHCSLFDVQVAGYVLQGGSGGMTLKDMAFQHLNRVMRDETSGEQQFFTFDWGGQCAVIYQLYEKFNGALTENSNTSSSWTLRKLFDEVEMPLVPVLTTMERNGITLDVAYLNKIAKRLDAKIQKLEKQIFDVVGHEFNVNSPQQVAAVLFEELQLPVVSKTRKGGISTSSSVLHTLQGEHPVIDHLLDYRELSKLRSTYTTTLIDLVRDETGRIHTQFNQTVTATGRLSSSNPNMQNIPVSTKWGREVRGAFVAENGNNLVSFDYSQQELRILAHLADEQSLIDAFERDEDVHALTASKLFNKDIQKVTKKERSVGKTINFGVMYGMGSYGLSSSLDISQEKAQDFIDRYFKEYSSVKSFYDEFLMKVARDGYAETIFGRRKYVGQLSESQQSYTGGTRRELINFPIQGTAADIMKYAMIACNHVMLQNFAQARMLLQVHDELIFEFPEGDKKQTDRFVKSMSKTMSEVFPLKVPVRVDFSIGRSLKELK